MPEVSNTPSGGSPSISMASGLPASVSTSAGTVVTGAGPAGPYSAPHYALYQDSEFESVSLRQPIKSLNRIFPNTALRLDSQTLESLLVGILDY